MKKIMKDLRSMSDEQLGKEALILREEIAKLRLEKNIGTKKDTNVIEKKRRRLAVVLTLMKEKLS